MTDLTKHFLISGRVQGVSYRAFAHRTALNLSIRGWTRNLQDGRVEVLACGSPEALVQFESCLRQGPSRAHVDQLKSQIVRVEQTWNGFQIHSDGDQAWQRDS